jgi:hypothetical protein
LDELKWRNFVPNPSEPAFFLTIAQAAFGKESDGSVRDIIAEKSIVGGNVFRPHDAPQHDVLSFSR